MRNPQEAGINRTPYNIVKSPSRRKFLKDAALVSGSSAIGIGAIVGGVSMLEMVVTHLSEARKHPKLPQDDVRRAREEVTVFERKVRHLAEKGELNQVPQVADAQKIQGAYQLIAQDSAPRREAEKVLEERKNGERLVGSIFAGLLGGVLVSFGIEPNKKGA